jgi:hypothetical protein
MDSGDVDEGIKTCEVGIEIYGCAWGYLCLWWW